MKTFTDAAGRTWTLTLNLGTAMAVKAKLGIDLLQPEAPRNGDPEGPPLLPLFGTDEMLLGEVLCALLEKQFETHKVTEDDVRAAFDGQTLFAAQKTFYEEMIDFFRSRGRNDRAKAVAKQMAMIDAAVTAIETKLDRIDPRKIIDETIHFGGGGMSGDSPDPPASIPTAFVGCAATPEDRWYQQREALTTANEVYLANLPLMSDEQIVHHGELLQAARSTLEQARVHLPEGGSSFNAALDVVKAILIRLAEPSPHAPVTETEPDERH